MARKLSEIQLMLDGMDFAKQWISDLRKDVKNLGGNDAMTYNAIKSDSKLRKEFAKLIVIGTNTAKNILHILSNLSFQDRIARGKYGWVNSDITEEHFPMNIPADYDAEQKLYHFNRSISSDDAIKEMEKDGFRPATLAELLVLGETQPELQREFPIIALASLWRNSNDNRNVPELNCDSDKRKLNLNWFENDWNDNYRFLAVRKFLYDFIPLFVAGFLLVIIV